MNMHPIAILEASNPVAIVTDEQKYSEFYAKVKAATETLDPDITTPKGREEIKSMAYKVTRTKTALDAAGKTLNEDAQKTINAVNATRKKIRDELDALAKTVRQPLTDWEEVEDARNQSIKDFFAEIDRHVMVGAAETSDDVTSRIEIVSSIQVDDNLFRDRADEAREAQKNALESLTKVLDTLKEREDSARELEQLRAVQRERERLDREKEEREAAEKAEAERVERERLARETAEKEEAERAERDAALLKEREEQAAKQARETAERKAAEKLAKVEAEKQAVIDAQEKAEQDRLAEVKRQAEEQAARDADAQHRNKIKGAVVRSFKALGAADNTAQKIMLAIIAGEIPNVTLRF